MLDYDLPQLDRYRNKLDLKQTSKVSSKKSNKKKRNQNSLPSTTDATTVKHVHEQAHTQEDIEGSESGATDNHPTDDTNVQPERILLKIKRPTKNKITNKTNKAAKRRSATKVDMETAQQHASNAHGDSQTEGASQHSELVDNSPKRKFRKRKREKSQKNQNNENVPRKKTKTIRSPMADEGFAEAQNIHGMPENGTHQGDDSGMEYEAVEGENDAPVRNHFFDAQTVTNHPANNNQSGTTRNAATRLEK